MREATSPIDALVPVTRRKGRSCVRRSNRRRRRARQCVELHVALDLAPLAIQLIELPRKLDRALEAVGGQTLDTDRHVGQASRCVDARADGKAEIARTAVRASLPAI